MDIYVSCKSQCGIGIEGVIKNIFLKLNFQADKSKIHESELSVLIQKSARKSEASHIYGKIVTDIQISQLRL